MRLERAGAEYVASQRYNADRAEARVNLATFYANRGDAAKAETEFKAATRSQPAVYSGVRESWPTCTAREGATTKVNESCATDSR